MLNSNEVKFILGVALSKSGGETVKTYIAVPCELEQRPAQRLGSADYQQTNY
jgi:hypothetical protein